jgi:hypothetical protein
MAERGHPSITLGDLVIATIIQAMENDSSRDALSDHDGLTKGGWFSGHVPRSYKLRRSMLREDLRDQLLRVIAEIAKHVYQLERWYAIDSTYCKTSYYEGWANVSTDDGKSHMQKIKNAKLFIARGLKSGVPVAVAVTDEYVGDQTMFEPLLRQMLDKGAILKGGGVIADAGFNKRQHYDLIATHGGRAFLDFDSDALPSNGKFPHYDEQYRLYKAHRDEWASFFCYRSLIETTNHALKSIKMILRARKPISREIEALALVAYYSLSRLPELWLKYRIDLPFVDTQALGFISDAMRPRRRGAALGPEEIAEERAGRNRVVALHRQSLGGILIA